MTTNPHHPVRRRLHPPEPVAPGDDPPGTVRRELGDDGPVVRKRRSGAAGDRLELEIEVLRAIDCDRAVRVVESHSTPDTVEMVTYAAGSATVADLTGVPPVRVLRILASGADALRSLHRSGWAHGQVRAEHLVVGGRGAVTLCSLGEARPVAARPEGPAADRAAFRAVLDRAAEQVWSAPGGRRRRRRAAQAIRAAARCSDDLGATHRVLVDAAAGMTRPAQVRPAAAAAGVVAVLGAAAFSTTGATPGRPSAPTVVVDGATYAVGRPGDVAVAADLGCTGVPGVVVVRQRTGQLFAAPRLPSDGRAVRLVALGRSAGARAVRTVARPGTRPAGCPEVLVERADAPDLVLNPSLSASPDGTTSKDPP